MKLKKVSRLFQFAAAIQDLIDILVLVTLIAYFVFQSVQIIIVVRRHLFAAFSHTVVVITRTAAVVHHAALKGFGKVHSANENHHNPNCCVE